jgi:hypothetical protein
MSRAVASLHTDRERPERSRLLVCRAVAAIFAIAACAGGAWAGDEPAATPRPIASRVPVERSGGPSLPTLFSEGSVADVRGKIVQSTRGRPGPVRLEVETDGGGKPLDVLVVPDTICDELGLSLRTGEQVHLRGSHFAGKSPIFVASAVVVDGKAIALHNRAAHPRPGPTASAPLPAARAKRR